MMYICEVCKKQIATIHITDIHNNVKKELHMCEGCAEAKGVSVKQSLSVPQIMASLGKGAAKTKVKRERNLTCDQCGMTWREFRTRGRLGCAHDYTAFATHLKPMLGEIHGGAEKHRGKSLRVDPAARDVRREIAECQRQLREAVEREAYEEAAVLRDRLARLQPPEKE